MVCGVDDPDLNSMMDFEPATLIDRLQYHGYEKILDDLGIVDQYRSEKRTGDDVRRVIARLSQTFRYLPPSFQEDTAYLTKAMRYTLVHVHYHTSPFLKTS